MCANGEIKQLEAAILLCVRFWKLWSFPTPSVNAISDQYLSKETFFSDLMASFIIAQTLSQMIPIFVEV